MFAEATNSFTFGQGFKDSGLIDTSRQTVARNNGMPSRQSEIKAMLAALETENRLHRRPCPTCGNLVKPRLQGQHDSAYHTKRR